MQGIREIEAAADENAYSQWRRSGESERSALEMGGWQEARWTQTS